MGRNCVNDRDKGNTKTGGQIGGDGSQCISIISFLLTEFRKAEAIIGGKGERTAHAGKNSQDNDQNARCRRCYQRKAEGGKKNPRKGEEKGFLITEMLNNKGSKWLYANVPQKDKENIGAGFHRGPSEVTLEKYG